MEIKDLLLEQFLREFNKMVEDERTGARDLQRNYAAVSKALDEFYFFNKLRLYNRILSIGGIVNGEAFGFSLQDINLMPEIHFMVQSGRADSPQVQIFHLIRILFERLEQPEPYDDLIISKIDTLLREFQTVLLPEERQEVYSFLTNYCIKRLNSNQPEYAKRSFKFHQQLIKLLLETAPGDVPTILTPTFRNMVMAALSIEDDAFFKNLNDELLPKKNGFQNGPAWAEQFIRVYKPYLEGNDAKATADYCTALICFMNEKFDQAYYLLKPHSKNRKLIFSLEVRLLYLAILFDLMLHQPTVLRAEGIDMEQKITSLRRALDRDRRNRKEIPAKVPFYDQFRQLYHQLYTLHRKYSNVYKFKEEPDFVKDRARLIEDLRGFKSKYAAWFLKKIDEIK